MFRRIQPFTYLIIGLNLYLGFLLSIHHFGLSTLVNWGAMYNQMPAIQNLNQLPLLQSIDYQAGDMTLVVIRSIYASFLHFSWMHLASNMLVFYIVGRQFENTNYFGVLPIVYLITGSISMMSAYALQPTVVTAGASGAIFGVLGVSFVSAWRARYLYNRDRMLAPQVDMYVRNGNYAYFLIVFNLISTFLTPNVSIVAHISGLITGIVIGAVVPLRKK